MDEMSFVLKMRDFVISRKNGMPFGPVSENVVQDAEKQLGFSIPSLLRLCYLAVGNGGYGPGFGIIGLKGGYASDYGTLLETYESLHNLLLEARQLLKEATRPGRMESSALLPFCEFGCNIFACVDVENIQHIVYSSEEGELWREKYNLREFFEMWMEGIDYSSRQDGIEVVERRIINPFTGKTDVARARRRRRQ